MNKDSCSFMNVSQCNAPVCVMNVFVLFFALEVIHIVSAFMSSKIYILDFHFFELQVIPSPVPSIKADH